MAGTKINRGVVFRSIALLALIAFAWFFPGIILYIFLAYIFALICKPLSRLICKAHIKGRHIPPWVGATLSLVFYTAVFGLTLLFFVPSLIQEVRALENINYEALSQGLGRFLSNTQDFLYSNGIMDRETTLVGIITSSIRDMISLNSISGLVGGIISSAGSFLMGLFCVLFVAFFFIKDDIDMGRIAGFFVAENHTGRVNQATAKINNLLSRYFIGSLARIIIMIVLLYIGFAIFGIRGAVFHSTMGGVLNIIPYLGPIIGAVISCFFGLIECLSTEMYSEILPLMLKIIGIYVAANAVDNVVLQPVIFSQSVNAHPVEIFLITIMGGDVAGIAGMILAIPVYTIIRVTVIEIYNYSRGNATLPTADGAT